MHEAVRVLLGLAPVLCFLVALFALDSFKLVTGGELARAIAAGAVVAMACLLAAHALVGRGVVATPSYVRFVAPLLEEFAKALPIAALIRARRIGFIVDAAILGFAVGAGFAVAENLYYLAVLPESNLLLWAVRGFGTAIMHGGATAIVALVAKLLCDQRGEPRLAAFLPGLAIAAAAHAFFNQFALPPLTQTVLLVASFPLLVIAVFSFSEVRMRRWLDTGMGSDVELLEMLRSGEVSDTRVGRYVRTLRDRFPGAVLADMLCYLQLWAELSIKAKGHLLMREAGFTPPPDPLIPSRLEELAFLESSLGATGRLALAPFLHRSSREEWGLERLRENAARQG